MTAKDNLTEPSNTAITVQALTQFCDDYLSTDAFTDYAPNGLQVDGGQPRA